MLAGNIFEWQKNEIMTIEIAQKKKKQKLLNKYVTDHKKKIIDICFAKKRNNLLTRDFIIKLMPMVNE